MTTFALKSARRGAPIGSRRHAGPARRTARGGASVAFDPGQAIGRAVQLAPQHADISQAELARRVDVYPASVYGWETGSRVPSGAHLLSLIAVLPEFARLLTQAARESAPTRSSRPRTV
jgi:DNA-binding XRE family transcriptional regulator